MTLLFIHGAGCTAEVFAAQRPAFAGAHFLPLPGHDAPGTCASIREFAEFVERYVRQRDLTDVVLAGSSMGGAIALEIALHAAIPVSGIVLLGSGARLRVAPALLEGLERDFEATAHTIAGFFFAEATPERLSAAVAAMRNVGREQTLRDFRACDAFDLRDRLDALTVPLLAVTGERDALTPPKFARFLGDRVAGAEVRILPGAGHLAMVERPNETNEAIEQFVQRLTARA